MLRATNTGITSAIAPDGREVARLPWFTRGILEVEVTGRTGLTPYVRWGDLPVAAVAIALLIAVVISARRKPVARAGESASTSPGISNSPWPSNS